MKLIYKTKDVKLLNETVAHFRFLKSKEIRKFYHSGQHHDILLHKYPQCINLLLQMQKINNKIQQWRQINSQIAQITNAKQRCRFLCYLHYLLVLYTKDRDYLELPLFILTSGITDPDSFDLETLQQKAYQLNLPCINMLDYELTILIAKAINIGKLSDMQALLISVTYQLPKLNVIGYYSSPILMKKFIRFLPLVYVYYYYEHVISFYYHRIYKFCYNDLYQMLHHEEIKNNFIINLNNARDEHRHLWYICELVYKKWTSGKII